MCASFLATEPTRASGGATALDLSALPWTVSIEGRQGAIATAPFEEALDALMNEFEYADVAVFEVAVPIARDHLSAPHAFVLGPIHTASEVYLDDQLIGRSGSITNRGREYLDLGPGRQTQAMFLPNQITSPGTYILKIRAQAKVYSPGPVRGPHALLPAVDALSIAQANNRVHFIAETIWFTVTLAAVLFVVFRVGFDFNSQNRDRWLPLMLLTGLGTLGVHTFTFNELGLLSPLMVRLGASLPIHLLLLLHLYAALGLKPPGWQINVILGLTLLYIIAVWWDMPTEFHIAKELLSAAAATTLLLFVGFAALRTARMDHRVSVWTYAYIVYLVVFLVSFIVLTPSMDLLVDPGLIMVLVGICILVLGAIDHARWEREAVSTLSRELLHSGEHERGRLARELHDGLSHRLALIRMRLESVVRASGERSNVAIEAIEELRGSSDELTAIVEGLRPLSLTGGNLQVALEAFADRWRRMSNIEVETKIEADVFPDEETQLHLLRIAQEAVQNAVRHGNASHISITLEQNGRHLMLSIKDDGEGFQLETTNSEKGVGLTAMKQRTELLNGTLNIESSIGEGTTVRVKVSLK